MKYEYEWKSVVLPMPSLPIDSPIVRALEDASLRERHDIELILGMRGESHTSECDICDRREPAQIPSLVGRWGQE